MKGNGARPYSQFGIEELEAIVSRPGAARSVLARVLDELDYRKTQRAERLRGLLRDQLENPRGDGLAANSGVQDSDAAGMSDLFDDLPAASGNTQDKSSEPSAALQRADPAPAARPVPIALRAVTDRMEDILGAWTVLEVLSPSTYVNPADLAGRDASRVARLGRGLPWSDGPARSKPGSHLYFQIVLGAIEMRPAMDRLLRRFADDRPERQQARGKTPLAVIIVDRAGRPVPDACAVVSSFAWGFPKVLRDDPATLAGWTGAEERLQEALHDRLYSKDEKNGVLPHSATSHS